MSLPKYCIDQWAEVRFAKQTPVVISCGEGLVGTAPKDRVDPQRQPCGEVDPVSDQAEISTISHESPEQANVWDDFVPSSCS